MNILVIAPHADDEILGVGGTIARFIREGHEVSVCIVSKGVSPLYREEFVNEVLKEAENSHALLGVMKAYLLDFPAAMLETVNRSELNDKLYKVIEEVKPDMVFLPHYGDLQKDHRIVAEAAMVALRPKYSHKVKAVFSYETLSETEWSTPNAENAFIPNVYVDISGYMERKLAAMQEYRSQLSDFPNPRSLEAIKALARYRGSTIHAEAAEAFALVRLIL